MGGIEKQQSIKNADERYILRIMKYIYTKIYGIDPRLTDIKRRSDFFLLMQPERIPVL